MADAHGKDEQQAIFKRIDLAITKKNEEYSFPAYRSTC
jgi:hypothetical protein